MHNSTICGRLTMLISAVGLTISSFTSVQAQYYESYSTINTYAGKGGNPANSQRWYSGIAVDSDGNTYYTESTLHQVIKVDAVTHQKSVIAGTTMGFSGDGNLAVDAQLSTPVGLAIDSRGNIYIGDVGNKRVRKIDKATNTISTFAGIGGDDVVDGDGGPAVSAKINVWGLAMDRSDNLYIADNIRNVVRKVYGQTGTIITIAGFVNGYVGGDAGDGLPATLALFAGIRNICVAADGNLYIADYYNNRIRKVDAYTSVVTTIVGGSGSNSYYNNMPALQMPLRLPHAVSVDGSGNLYITPEDFTGDNAIYKYDAALQTVAVFAGTHEQGFWGNNVLATAARLTAPGAMTIDPFDNLFFTQPMYQSVRKVDLISNIISDVYVDKGSVAGDIGDGGDADSAQFNIPRDIAVDRDGNVYLADGVNQRVRKINKLTNIITTIAGTGEAGNGGAGGPATEARFKDPAGMAFDNQGNLLIADRFNDQIKKVDKLTNIITVIVGGVGTNYGYGIGGPAIDAIIHKPTDMAVDADGNIYISTSNDVHFGNVIYKVSTDGNIHYFAGLPIVPTQSNAGYSGDGGLATNARLTDPHGMVVDAAGNLIFCDKGNHVIRKINLQTNVITTIAGTGHAGRAGDGGLAINAELHSPDDIAINPDGNLVIADLGNNQMRLLDLHNNKLYTVAGTGNIGFSGDGGQAVLAELNQVDGMAIDVNGLTYIADQFNNRIRTFTMPSIITGLLPVSIINFKAAAIGQNALLQWSTTSEQHAAYFIVERSVNGKDNWRAVGTIAAAGNSSLLKNYSFTDENAPSGNNYYRLQQVDADLKAAFSSTVVVSFKNTANLEFAVYPNPVIDHTIITLNSNSNYKGLIKIIDASGAVQFQKTIEVQSGNNTFTISSLAALSSGIYMLQVNIDGSNIPMTKKLLKL